MLQQLSQPQMLQQLLHQKKTRHSELAPSSFRLSPLQHVLSLNTSCNFLVINKCNRLKWRLIEWTTQRVNQTLEHGSRLVLRPHSAWMLICTFVGHSIQFKAVNVMQIYYGALTIDEMTCFFLTISQIFILRARRIHVCFQERLFMFFYRDQKRLKRLCRITTTKDLFKHSDGTWKR